MDVLGRRYSILILLALWIAAIMGTIVRFGELERILDDLLLSLLIIVPAMASPFIYAIKRRWGRCHWATSAVVLFSLVVDSWRVEILPDWAFFTVVLVLYPAMCISFFIAVPVCIIPYFRRDIREEDEDALPGLDTGFLHQGFENIRDAFRTVQDAISREAKGIDSAVLAFQRQFEIQTANLTTLQEDLERTKAELRKYRAIASLTKGQRDALLSVLGRRKYVDYLVGFLLGIIGSAIARLLPEIFRSIAD